MIIKISQTASNIKQSYEIEGENFYYQGDTGSFCRLQDITLYNKENTIKGSYKFSKWFNYIPYRYLFGAYNVTRRFNIYKNESIYGSVKYSRHGYFKSFYTVSLESGESFNCYDRAIGSFDYVSIYQGDNQIALLETHLNVDDYKYTHKLYILEDYNYLSDALSFFVLYYANYNFAKRFHMSIGSNYEKSWSISKYNDKYNSKWREQNFPQENFFGKTSLID